MKMILPNKIRWGKSLFALAIFVLFGLSLNAQNSTDYGAMLTAEYQHQFDDKWDLVFKEDLRFDNNVSQYSRWKNTLIVGYKFRRNALEGLKLSMAFDHINKYTGSHIYRNRYRWALNVVYKYPYRNWSFAFRTRYQLMLHDESTGYYNYELQHVWRNKLTVDYHEKNSRWRYTAWGELFSEIRSDRALFLESIMLALNVEYRLTRYQYIMLYARDYRDVYIKSDQVRTIYFGLGWKYKR